MAGTKVWGVVDIRPDVQGSHARAAEEPDEPQKATRKTDTKHRRKQAPIER